MFKPQKLELRVPVIRKCTAAPIKCANLGLHRPHCPQRKAVAMPGRKKKKNVMVPCQISRSVDSDVVPKIDHKFWMIQNHWPGSCFCLCCMGIYIYTHMITIIRTHHVCIYIYYIVYCTYYCTRTSNIHIQHMHNIAQY